MPDVDSSYIKFVSVIKGDVENLSDESVTKICQYGIHHFDNLKNISFPNCTRIDNYGISYNSGIIAIDLPSLNSIGQNGINSNSNLESVNIPKLKYNSIVPSSLADNVKLSEIILPEDNKAVTVNSTFAGTGLTNWVDNISNVVDANVFSRCSNLISFEGSNVTIIGSYAFSQCTSLTTLSLPSLKFIYGSAFNNCTSLKTLDVSNVVGVNANFIYGTQIEKLHFKQYGQDPNHTYVSNPTIQGNSFNGASKLQTIIFEVNEVLPLGTAASNVFRGVHSQYKVYVPDDLIDSYKAATNWSAIASRILPISNLPS